MTVRPVLDCCGAVDVLRWDCCWSVVGLVLDCCWTCGGKLATIGEAGEGVIIRAGVGGGEDKETREGGEGRELREGERGLMAAERRASRGEGAAMGWTRIRPSSFIVWFLCRSQHGWQMRLLIETSMVEFSCSVNTSGEGRG